MHTPSFCLNMVWEGIQRTGGWIWAFRHVSQSFVYQTSGYLFFFSVVRYGAMPTQVKKLRCPAMLFWGREPPYSTNCWKWNFSKLTWAQLYICKKFWGQTNLWYDEGRFSEVYWYTHSEWCASAIRQSLSDRSGPFVQKLTQNRVFPQISRWHTVEPHCGML